MLYDKKRWEPKVPVKVLTPVQKVLLDAAQYIRDHDWCQYILVDHKGRVCASGAITQGIPPIILSQDIMEAHRRLQRQLGVTSIPGWNDHPHRTKEQVIAALEAAAQLEE